MFLEIHFILPYSYETELLLHKIKHASKASGLLLNLSESKYMHTNPDFSPHLYTTNQVKKVDGFK